LERDILLFDGETFELKKWEAWRKEKQTLQDLFTFFFQIQYSETCEIRIPLGSAKSIPYSEVSSFHCAIYTENSSLGLGEVSLFHRMSLFHRAAIHRFHCTTILYCLYANFLVDCSATHFFACVVGLVSASGKHVEPLIERSLVRNLDWTCDNDHILSPITISWFAGVSIMWPAALNMLQCLWA
jgi:hypothetical protein